MYLRDVVTLLEAEVLGENANLDLVVRTACGADLMSTVLAFVHAGVLLLNGLTHQQVIRSAEMVDATAIVFVRGKLPSRPTLALARERGIPTLATKLTMFESCGRLSAAGLEACDVRGEERKQSDSRVAEFASAPLAARHAGELSIG